ncbi:unnamed protein product, partial [Prorocentrum cordatum]
MLVARMKGVVRHRLFEVSMAAAVVINALVLVVETDTRPEEDTVLWLALDWVFTMIFSIELGMRVLASQWNWHRSAWNVFDAVLVAISWIDVMVLPLLQGSLELRILSVFRVVRLFRMLRILRLLRIFRFAHQLVLLLHAIWTAMRTMVWAVALVAMVLYTFGMLITRMVGKSCCDEDDMFQEPLILEWYGTLPRTMFTLFQFMTLEGWPEIARTTMAYPWLTCFYVFFILLTSVSLLNTVAGVLTESILDTSRKKHEERDEAEDRKLEERLNELAKEFTEADRGRLDQYALIEAAESPGPLRDFLTKVQYMDHAGNMEPALDLFRLLADGDDMVSREAFVDSVRSSRGRIRSKHLLALRREIRKTDPVLLEADAHLGRVEVQILDLQGLAAPPRGPRPGEPRAAPALAEAPRAAPSGAA